ncbi:hypothetical protein L208DRAFT_1346715 [Tricholoma matsutake]|nr:hypothetical protein L208DRAFT_1346715 [Tricholoma matsutake 945]
MSQVASNTKLPEYKNPTETMPSPPPPSCNISESHTLLEYKACMRSSTWWGYFRQTIDDLLVKSNIHSCNQNKNKDGSINKRHAYTGCMDNKWGKCKARFPQQLFDQTKVNKETGSLDVKKKESWLNTFTPVLTYIFHCNTDVTCLMSGTAMKSVILYVSDYITKAPLKTHVIFESIRSIFTKNMELVNGTLPSREKARRLMAKVVNLLSARMEMGAVMISMYLLGHPDHYTNCRFVPFYWQNYVTEAHKFWHPDESIEYKVKVALVKLKGKIIGLSPVFDYMYSAPELEHLNLYDWIKRCTREKIPCKSSKSKSKSTDEIRDTTKN